MKIPSAALLVLLTTTARSFTPSVPPTRNKNVAVSFLTTTCHASSHDEQDNHDTKRRTLLDSLRGAVNALPFIGKADAASSAAAISEKGGPIADFPMRRYVC